MSNSIYDTKEYRALLVLYLKLDQQNSGRLRRDHGDFYNWLMASCFGKNKKEKLYCYLNRLLVAPVCKSCGNSVAVQNIWKGYARFCSYVCSNNNPEKQQHSKTTLQNNYGVDNPSKCETIQQKKIETNFVKYGAKHYMSSEEGKAHYIKMNQEKYGEDWFVSTEKFQQQYTNNSISKYGVNRPQQTGQYWEECNTFKLKPYTLKTGDIIEIQGYDGFLIDFLLDSKIKLNEIAYRKTDVPIITYDRIHKYFPDAYIEKNNTVYEAKSEWTYNLDLNKNIKKREAAIESGFSHYFVIFSPNGKMIEMW